MVSEGRFSSQREGRKEAYKNQDSSKLKDGKSNPSHDQTLDQRSIYNSKGFRCQQCSDLRVCDNSFDKFIYNISVSQFEYLRYQISRELDSKAYRGVHMDNYSNQKLYYLMDCYASWHATSIRYVSAVCWKAIFLSRISVNGSIKTSTPTTTNMIKVNTLSSQSSKYLFIL